MDLGILSSLTAAKGITINYLPHNPPPQRIFRMLICKNYENSCLENLESFTKNFESYIWKARTMVIQETTCDF